MFEALNNMEPLTYLRVGQVWRSWAVYLEEVNFQRLLKGWVGIIQEVMKAKGDVWLFLPLGHREWLCVCLCARACVCVLGPGDYRGAISRSRFLEWKYKISLTDEWGWKAVKVMGVLIMEGIRMVGRVLLAMDFSWVLIHPVGQPWNVWSRRMFWKVVLASIRGMDLRKICVEGREPVKRFLRVLALTLVKSLLKFGERNTD